MTTAIIIITTVFHELPSTIHYGTFYAVVNAITRTTASYMSPSSHNNNGNNDGSNNQYMYVFDAKPSAFTMKTRNSMVAHFDAVFDAPSVYNISGNNNTAGVDYVTHSPIADEAISFSVAVILQSHHPIYQFISFDSAVNVC